MTYQYIGIPGVPGVRNKATTTIKVSKKTLQLLEELKKKLNASSYEDVILKLVYMYRKRIIEEYFGVDQGEITGFTEADRGEDREY